MKITTGRRTIYISKDQESGLHRLLALRSDEPISPLLDTFAAGTFR